MKLVIYDCPGLALIYTWISGFIDNWSEIDELLYCFNALLVIIKYSGSNWELVINVNNRCQLADVALINAADVVSVLPG